MRDDFHLVVETPTADLMAGMRWFLSAYTIRLNHRQKRFGHVFSGRYKALKNDPGKLGLAARVRKETTLPIKWIAQRLQMGTAKSLKPMLLDWMHEHEKPPEPTITYQEFMRTASIPTSGLTTFQKATQRSAP